MKKLSPNFMAELFKLMFMDETIIRIAFGHLTYQLIPKEWVGYKFIFREAIEQYGKREVVPSLGVIEQKYCNNEIVLSTIDEIKEAQKVDRELLIDQLELYLKETEFELLSKRVHDLYEEGKREEAIRINAEESKRILDISLRETGGNFIQVFGGFQGRIKKKRLEKIKENKQEKISFGIDRLDDISFGGADLGDTVLWIMRSGIGKSTALKWHGYTAALSGKSVLHIQLEGGADACVDKYDQIWTNQTWVDIRSGNLNPKDEIQINKTLKDMMNFNQDIEVYGFKKFGEASIYEVRNLCFEYFKIKGRFPQLLIIDSLDLLKTGINKKIDNDPDFKKERLERCAQLYKDLCEEIKCVGITATQTGDVPIEIWNNEDKVIDRSYTEGNRTLVKPFSFVFTGNVTMDEKKQNKLRVFIDKLRDYKNSQEVFTIATNYSKGKFYDKKQTMALYSSVLEKTTTNKKKEKLSKNDSKVKVI